MNTHDGSIFGEVIYSYTRTQAISDGVLVDVSRTREAIESGFKYPVALTRAVWNKCVEVPEGVAGQDIPGRLWDVLYLLRFAIQRMPGGHDTVYFEVHVRNDNREGIPPLVALKAVCGPGDDGEPVITVMFPEED